MSNKLTGKEREEWTSILTNKALKKIQQLEKDNPQLGDPMRSRARAEAIQQLDLLDDLPALKESLRLMTLRQQSLERVFNSHIDRLGMREHYWADQTIETAEELYRHKLGVIEQAITNKTEEVIDDLMKEDPVGAKIVELREAVNGGIRTAVLLSTSSDALKRLWDSFTDKLDLPKSAIEKTAAEGAA